MVRNVYSLDRTVTVDGNKLVDESTLNDVSGSNTEGEFSVTLEAEKEVEELELCVRREHKFKQLQKKWEMLAEKQSPDSVCREMFSNKSMLVVLFFIKHYQRMNTKICIGCFTSM